jgi:hypothetical protein
MSNQQITENPTGAGKKHLLRRAKTEGGLEKYLANPGSREKITKTTHAGRGRETKWEIPV